MFSKSQRAHRKVELKEELGKCNVNHNCCKDCNKEYFIPPDCHAQNNARATPTPPSTCPPSPPMPASHQSPPQEGNPWEMLAAQSQGVYAYGKAPVVTDAMFLKAHQVCVDEIPVSFWDTFHDNVTYHAQSEKSRALFKIIQSAWASQVPQAPGISGLKLMSHFGAVRAHEFIEGEVYDRSGDAYFDATNKVYTYVLQSVWPGTLKWMRNPETIGDVMEAFLGLCWLHCHPDSHKILKVKRFTGSQLLLALRLRQNVEQVILWIYDHWETPELHDMMLQIKR